MSSNVSECPLLETFFTTNCFIHGLLLTGSLGIQLQRYETLAFHSPYQVHTLACWYHVVQACQSDVELIRIYTTMSLQGMLSSDNNHCVLQCCTATLLIDIHVKPVFITAQLQFINILGTEVNSSLWWCFSHSMSTLLATLQLAQV